jgi:hypothetical protein
MSSDLQPPAVAKPAANLVNISPDAPFLRFPPFPQVPEGVTIVPFDKFQEHGIQMFTEDGDDELDGLGIPTVELRVKHDTDVCKTNAKRKKKKKVEVVGVKSTSVRKEWWEQWQEGEDLRLTSSINPYVALHLSLFLLRRELLKIITNNGDGICQIDMFELPPLFTSTLLYAWSNC